MKNSTITMTRKQRAVCARHARHVYVCKCGRTIKGNAYYRHIQACEHHR